MTKAICRLHELSITFTDGRAKTFAFGREYDLDEPFAGAPLRDHLGSLVAKFDPVVPAPTQTQTNPAERPAASKKEK